MLVPDDPLSGFSDLLENFLFEGIVSQEPSKVIYFSTVDDDDRVAWLILLVYGHFGDLFDDFHSVDHLPEDHMFAIEMRAGLERDEELRGVGVSAAVGHRKQSCTGMSPRKALIHKGTSVDREATLSTSIRDVSSLDHKSINDAMKLCVQIMQLGLVWSLAVLTSAEASEILSSFGSEVVEQLEDHPAGSCGPDLDIDVHLVVGL